MEHLYAILLTGALHAAVFGLLLGYLARQRRQAGCRLHDWRWLAESGAYICAKCGFEAG